MKEIFQNQYPGIETIISQVFIPVFNAENFTPTNEDVLQNNPNKKNVAERANVQSIVRKGTFSLGIQPIEVFDITLSGKTKLSYSRVGIQQVVRSLLDVHSGALMIFHYENATENDEWRISFVKKEDTLDNSSSAKRYTYLCGTQHQCRTIAERFEWLKKQPEKSVDALLETFSVEVLSKEFFNSYKSHYTQFCKYLLESASYKKKFKSDNNYKEIRDFCKKLLGRIVFLYFLQKKGWLGASDESYTDGDKNFLQNYFRETGNSKLFYSQYLQKLFFDTLNKKRKNDHFVMPTGEMVKIPFLNGGLFENDFNHNDSINFPAEKFQSLFEFFDQFNFTIYEDDPRDQTVAVDPEMLGHIFENLLEDNKDKGAFYTPKEIVHYMCIESLKEYLKTRLSQNSNKINGIARILDDLFSDNQESLSTLDENTVQAINEALDNVKICDPAIGSGAFPMGLLLEIFNAKQLLNIKNESAVEIKEKIIQNSIYGVDIEKGAVDIARLRFWLSLIIDEDLPRPLPNLDYKIMQGNSLLESYEGVELTQFSEGKNLKTVEEMQKDLFGNLVESQMNTTFGNKDVSDLQKKIQKYFSANDEEKQKLKLEIDKNVTTFIDYNLNKREEELTRNIANLESQTYALLNKNQRKNLDTWRIQRIELQGSRHRLQSFEKNDERPFFLWHLYFKDVFDKGGFDIVIGNPPILRGRDIKCYSYEFADLYLLFIPWHFPLQNDNSITGASEKAEQVFEQQYPAIYNHLLKYKKELSARNKAETGIRYEWYALQRWGANYWEDFSKQKIIFQEIVQEPSFILDNEGAYFCSDTGRIITGNDIEYLIAILNSKLFFFAVKHFYGGGGLGETGVRMKHTFFEKFHCPTFDSETRRKIDNLLHMQNYQAVDSLVYAMYRLLEEEIQFIEN